MSTTDIEPFVDWTPGQTKLTGGQVAGNMRGHEKRITAIEAIGLQPDRITAFAQSADGFTVTLSTASGGAYVIHLQPGPVTAWREDRVVGAHYAVGEAFVEDHVAYVTLLDHTASVDVETDRTAGRVRVVVRGGKDALKYRGFYSAATTYKALDAIQFTSDNLTVRTYQTFYDLPAGTAPGVQFQPDGFPFPIDAWSPVTADPVNAVDFDLAGKPAVSAVVKRRRIRKACSLPPTAPSSSAYIETAATAQTVFSVRRNGVEVGTITFAAGAKTGTFATTSAGSTAFAVGDRISVHAPATQDATAADLSGYIVLIGA